MKKSHALQTRMLNEIHIFKLHFKNLNVNFSSVRFYTTARPRTGDTSHSITDTERHRDRQTDRQTQRQTDTQTDRQTQRQTDRQRERDKQTDTETDRQTDTETDRQTDQHIGSHRKQ